MLELAAKFALENDEPFVIPFDASPAFVKAVGCRPLSLFWPDHRVHSIELTRRPRLLTCVVPSLPECHTKGIVLSSGIQINEQMLSLRSQAHLEMMLIERVLNDGGFNKYLPMTAQRPWNGHQSQLTGEE